MTTLPIRFANQRDVQAWKNPKARITRAELLNAFQRDSTVCDSILYVVTVSARRVTAYSLIVSGSTVGQLFMARSGTWNRVLGHNCCSSSRNHSRQLTYCSCANAQRIQPTGNLLSLVSLHVHGMCNSFVGAAMSFWPASSACSLFR